ncbi:MAG: hypothetical protein ACM31C_09195 [Acidobacteriota bacterium]
MTAPSTHVLTEQAPDSDARWTRVWTLDALRYRGSGGWALSHDRDAFLATHDCTCQLWFFPLHLVCVRIVGGLWAGGLGAARSARGRTSAGSSRARTSCSATSASG